MIGGIRLVHTPTIYEPSITHDKGNFIISVSVAYSGYSRRETSKVVFTRQPEDKYKYKLVYDDQFDDYMDKLSVNENTINKLINRIKKGAILLETIKTYPFVSKSVSGLYTAEQIYDMIIEPPADKKNTGLYGTLCIQEDNLANQARELPASQSARPLEPTRHSLPVYTNYNRPTEVSHT
jgi:hypothetical protein